MKNELKKAIIYQVFVRNFSKEGTFKAVEEKLDYIKNLKTDILYLLPINIIGKVGRKGDLGSPYAIQDYRVINPELGNLDDLKSLINKTHEKGMKIIIDIVFNHTSRDSWIMNNHPEWMYKNKEGKFANKAGDWSDVYDLDTENDELVKYLIDTLDFYLSIGIDGFRFDVCSLLSHKFFYNLKKMVDEKYPNTILLAESVHSQFIIHLRSNNFNSLCDADLFNHGIDMLYPYNVFEYFTKYLEEHDERYLTMYKAQLELDEASNPPSQLRVRGLENHDQKRLIEFSKDLNIRKNLLAHSVFMKGPFFIYNGLETKADHHIDLFTKDLLDLTIDENWYNFVIKLVDYKREDKNLKLLTSLPLMTKGENLVIRNFYEDQEVAYGLFNFTKDSITIKDKDLEDGKYIDYISNKEFEIKDNSITFKEPLYLFKK